MDLLTLLEPVDHLASNRQKLHSDAWHDGLSFLSSENSQDIASFDIALIAVNENRNSVSNVESSDQTSNEVRKHLLSFYQMNKAKVIDLGNLKLGHKPTDTYIALTELLAFLQKQDVIPIIIGGSHDLTFCMFKAFGQNEQIANMLVLDSKLDLGIADEPISDDNYLSKIILEQPNHLFNLCSLGHQSYYTPQANIELMNKLYFDVVRLGLLRNDISAAEPYLRNADAVSFDTSVLRYSDFNNDSSGPNGLYAEEFCQLARYAGMSDKVQSFGIFGFDGIQNGSGSEELIAQSIWYFIEGFMARKKDFPACNKSDYLKYNVSLEGSDEHLIFYKSEKSDRWWMEIPYPESLSGNYQRHLLTPCTYGHYEEALQEQIPEIWIKTRNKLV